MGHLPKEPAKGRYHIQDTDRVVFRNKVAEAWRKKKLIVLIVRFKDYLCHCLIVFLFVFCTYIIVIIYQKSNSYSTEFQKNSHFF